MVYETPKDGQMDPKRGSLYILRNKENSNIFYIFGTNMMKSIIWQGIWMFLLHASHSSECNQEMTLQDPSKVRV